MDVNVLLFDDFETLDAFGPVEVLGKVEEYRLRYFSEHGGTVASAQKTVIVTEPATEADGGGILVVPGGRGTRRLAVFPPFLHFLRGMADDAEYCLSVCTGAASLAGCDVTGTATIRADDYVDLDLRAVVDGNELCYWQFGETVRTEERRLSRGSQRLCLLQGTVHKEELRRWA